VDFAATWSVELGEEDALEATERQIAVEEGDRQRGRSKGRTDVRPRVSVALVDVLPVTLFGHKTFKCGLDVGGDLRRSVTACLKNDAAVVCGTKMLTAAALAPAMA